MGQWRTGDRPQVQVWGIRPRFAKWDWLVTLFKYIVLDVVDRLGGAGGRLSAFSGVRSFRGCVPSESIAIIADRQLIAIGQPALGDADTVDPHTVGAAEVADDKVIVDLGDDAVLAGDFAGIDLDVALGVAANQQNRLVQQDAG